MVISAVILIIWLSILGLFGAGQVFYTALCMIAILAWSVLLYKNVKVSMTLKTFADQCEEVGGYDAARSYIIATGGSSVYRVSGFNAIVAIALSFVIFLFGFKILASVYVITYGIVLFSLDYTNHSMKRLESLIDER